jgi:hypothetical protein
MHQRALSLYALRLTRFSGLIAIFALTTLIPLPQEVAACSSVFAYCVTDSQCDAREGTACLAGTAACPGQYMCGSHENCDEDLENQDALYCVVLEPE